MPATKLLSAAIAIWLLVEFYRFAWIVIKHKPAISPNGKAAIKAFVCAAFVTIIVQGYLAFTMTLLFDPLMKIGSVLQCVAMHYLVNSLDPKKGA